jgi:hypothetical protein
LGRWEGAAHQSRALHGGGHQSRGDAGEEAHHGPPASIDGSVSSTWTGQSSWAGQLGRGAIAGIQHRGGANGGRELSAGFGSWRLLTKEAPQDVPGSAHRGGAPEQ